MLVPLKGSFFLRLFLQNEPIIVTLPYVAQCFQKAAICGVFGATRSIIEGGVSFGGTVCPRTCRKKKIFP